MAAEERIAELDDRGGSRRSRRAETRARRERAAERKDALSAAIPYLASVRAPRLPAVTEEMGTELRVATYNVHRWTGLGARPAPDPARAAFVISELDADVIALQEVLRPFDAEDDPIARIADADGPIKTSPAAVTASTKSGFSDKNP